MLEMQNSSRTSAVLERKINEKKNLMEKILLRRLSFAQCLPPAQWALQLGWVSACQVFWPWQQLYGVSHLGSQLRQPPVPAAPGHGCPCPVSQQAPLVPNFPVSPVLKHFSQGRSKVLRTQCLAGFAWSRSTFMDGQSFNVCSQPQARTASLPVWQASPQHFHKQLPYLVWASGSSVWGEG